MNASRLRLASDPAVTIRLDCAGDASRLYQLAALTGIRLAPGPYVVADVDGRIVAARPLTRGSVVSDPSARTSGLHALLARQAALFDGLLTDAAESAAA